MYIHRIPTYTPPLKDMLSSICASPKDAACALKVSERSIRRWIKNDSAPWAVKVAIFWLTEHGISRLNADAFNRIEVLKWRLYALEAAK